LVVLWCRFALSEDVDLDAVARECAPTFTGADLYALCADAWMAALKRTMALVQTPHHACPALAPCSPLAVSSMSAAGMLLHVQCL
jgi:SpoVK/Ycf46/Vps4 family AAA+-type ATPase